MLVLFVCQYLQQVAHRRDFNPELKYDFRHICEAHNISHESRFISALWDGAIEDQNAYLQLRKKHNDICSRYSQAQETLAYYKLKEFKENKQFDLPQSYRQASRIIKHYVGLIHGVDEQIPDKINFGRRLVKQLIKTLGLETYFHDVYEKRFYKKLKKDLKEYRTNYQSRCNYAYWVLNAHLSRRDQRKLLFIVCLYIIIF